MIRKGSAWMGALALAVLCGACAQSDAGITTKVKAKLESDRNVTNSSAIQVETRSKVVTLSGQTASPSEKQHVVQLVKQTEGVKDVVDNLTINAAAAPAPAAPGSSSPNASGTPVPSNLPPEVAPTAAPSR